MRMKVWRSRRTRRTTKMRMITLTKFSQETQFSQEIQFSQELQGLIFFYNLPPLGGKESKGSLSIHWEGKWGRKSRKRDGREGGREMEGKVKKRNGKEKSG